MRALGLLARLGWVLVDFNEDDGSIEVRLRHAGEKPTRKRKPISQVQRVRLLQAEGYQCGHCGCQLELTTLRVDHLIPFSALGADHPGNWGALCAECNRDKWHNFDRYWLKRYRNQRVSGGLGVRLRDGQLWPLINGKLRFERRADWSLKEQG
ncbi:MAG: HNH endonuclease [Anaerolineales bacterium]